MRFPRRPANRTGWPVYYRDKLVKEGGRWLFKERQIEVHYLSESNPLQKLPGT